MSDLYPLGSRCIVCDPLYGDAPDLAVVRNGLVHVLNPQMKEVAYRRWFVVYGVSPADVCHMIDSGVVGAAPRYHPCGKLRAVLRILTLGICRFPRGFVFVYAPAA